MDRGAWVGGLKFMELQTVRHNWTTEHNSNHFDIIQVGYVQRSQIQRIVISQWNHTPLLYGLYLSHVKNIGTKFLKKAISSLTAKFFDNQDHKLNFEWFTLMARKWFTNIHIYSYKIKHYRDQKPELYVCIWEQIQIMKGRLLARGHP